MNFHDCNAAAKSAAENAYALHARAMLAKGLAPVRIIVGDKRPGWTSADGASYPEKDWDKPVSTVGVDAFLNPLAGKKAGLGVLCGPAGIVGPSPLVEPGEHIVFADFDAIDPEHAAKVRALLPACDCVTFGRGPKIAFRSRTITGNPKWLLPTVPGETKPRCAFEIKASGQVVLAGVHPAGMLYTNPEGPGLQDRTTLLPRLESDILPLIDAALAGYATRGGAKVERSENGERVTTSDASWRGVNEAALANPDSWVFALPWPEQPIRSAGYIKVVPFWVAGAKGTHSMSIYPNGITYNGNASDVRGYTAIDLVSAARGIESGPAKDWLESKLGIEKPTDASPFSPEFDATMAARKAAKAAPVASTGQGQATAAPQASPAPPAPTTPPAAPVPAPRPSASMRQCSRLKTPTRRHRVHGSTATSCRPAS